MGVAVISILLCLLAWSPAMSAEKTFVIKLAHVHVPEHPTSVGCLRFAKLMEERTNGRVKIEVYPGSQMGNERELYEALMMGTLEMGTISTSSIASFTRESGIWDLPFLFRDSGHAYRVMDGSIGKKVDAIALEKTGVRFIGYFENGWRHMTNKVRPINKPEDLNGLKIRSMTAPVMIETIRALGANPVPIAWGETYLALQQGVAEGQENPHVNTFGAKLYEVQKYVSLTGHVYNPQVFSVNNKFYESLPADIQKLILMTAKEVIDQARRESQALDSDFLKKLVEKGMIVNTPPDLAPFRAKGKIVYEKFASQVGGAGLINEIINTK
ncbi:MAG TPA: TRAP transporter substrate-binding protein [Candidatus Methylomirabilis sp.]|nr:TRAP transporter substrate-binding protein [Candidatus Methylomirabilis sp.]